MLTTFEAIEAAESDAWDCYGTEPAPGTQARAIARADAATATWAARRENWSNPEGVRAYRAAYRSAMLSQWSITHTGGVR